MTKRGVRPVTQLESTLEAVLFAAGDAVSLDRLCAALETPREDILAAARALEALYALENRGLMLRRIEDRLQLCSRPMYAEAARRVTESRRAATLSPAALEVLTIVAYRQPVTRAFIDQLRGVDSGGTLAGLAEKQLIEEAGRLEVPGRPILYRTTGRFLQAFALESLDDLPALPALTENEQLEFDTDPAPPDPSPLLRPVKE
ncbi:SMC-Scp complex subunit ScpB [Butyricicoccus sp. OM04-18BH]|nr:SMC-Scp complex subunit ScpB [Butyricicoccus sp. AM29-23AC]RHV42084.1 SMC-Scp complex subunit ScpB [Butyricicoccus sp. OM04-18BH]